VARQTFGPASRRRRRVRAPGPVAVRSDGALAEADQLAALLLPREQRDGESDLAAGFVPVVADGEMIGAAPFRAGSAPGLLPILVPAEA